MVTIKCTKDSIVSCFGDSHFGVHEKSILKLINWNSKLKFCPEIFLITTHSDIIITKLNLLKRVLIGILL